MMGILATEVGMNIWLAIVLTLIAAGASASRTATWS
jgi:general stress protein CsbA